MLWLLEVPLASFLIAPDWTPRAIDRANAWVSRHAHEFAVRGFAIVGALLTLKGLIGLVGRTWPDLISAQAPRRRAAGAALGKDPQKTQPEWQPTPRRSTGGFCFSASARQPKDASLSRPSLARELSDECFQVRSRSRRARCMCDSGATRAQRETGSSYCRERCVRCEHLLSGSPASLRSQVPPIPAGQTSLFRLALALVTVLLAGPDSATRVAAGRRSGAAPPTGRRRCGRGWRPSSGAQTVSDRLGV